MPLYTSTYLKNIISISRNKNLKWMLFIEKQINENNNKMNIVHKWQYFI